MTVGRKHQSLQVVDESADPIEDAISRIKNGKTSEEPLAQNLGQAWKLLEWRNGEMEWKVLPCEILLWALLQWLMELLLRPRPICQFYSLQ